MPGEVGLDCEDAWERLLSLRLEDDLMEAKVLLTLFLNFVRSDGPEARSSTCTRDGGTVEDTDGRERGASMSMSWSSKDGPSLVLDESAKEIMDTVASERSA